MSSSRFTPGAPPRPAPVSTRPSFSSYDPQRTIPSSEAPDLREGFEPSVLGAVFRDPARQLAFLRKFVDSARKTLGELESAWQRKAHDEISFAGHKLKSSAKACGAHSLATVCAELERHGKSADWLELAPLEGRAERLLDEVARHVERLENKN